MRFRSIVLAALAALAVTATARADIVLTYHLGNPQFEPTTPPNTDIPSNRAPDPVNGVFGFTALGPQISSLSMPVNSTVYLQVGMAATAGSTAAQNGGWALTPATQRLSSWGFVLNYPTSLVTQPWANPSTNNNLPNANASDPYGVGHPNTFANYNGGGTAMTGLTTSTTGAYGPNYTTNFGPFLLGTLKIVSGATPGSSTITLSELNPSPTASEFSLFDSTTNPTSLDPIVWAAAHNNFPLPLTVTPVPEPSSLALAGLAVVGLGYRTLRRKKTAEVAA